MSLLVEMDKPTSINVGGAVERAPTLFPRGNDLIPAVDYSQ